MIARATGLPVSSRLNPAELRAHEIRPQEAQGPVPACLRPGYTPPPVVLRIPSPTTCASSVPSRSERQTRPGHPKLPPSPAARVLQNIEDRRALVVAQLAGGVWRTAWEIATATGLHPEVVRATLHSLRAVSRVLPEVECRARGALVEFAAVGTAGATAEPRIRPRRWSHAFCEICERAEEFVEAPASGGGTDIVCSKCSSVVATLFRGPQEDRNVLTKRSASAGAQHEEDEMPETQNPQPKEPQQPTQPSQPTGPKTPTGDR